jgi:hypothetical protein
MIKKICILLVVVSLFLLSGTALAGGPNMKEGLWEVTVKMEMAGMPMQMPAQKFTQCLKKEDMVPQQKDPSQQCKMTNIDVKGDTVTWVIECKGPEGPMRGNGRVTYKGDTFDGFLNVKQADMEVTQRMSGKLIGPCK